MTHKPRALVQPPPPDRSPITFRCVGCGHTRPLPYETQDCQPCPDCGQPTYAYEHNGHRWNILWRGED